MAPEIALEKRERTIRDGYCVIDNILTEELLVDLRDETEMPFSVADLPEGEDVELRIFVDKYLVEIFINGRQAALTAHMAYRNGDNALNAYAFFGRSNNPTRIQRIEIWKLSPSNRGFLEARENRIWALDID